MLYRTFYGKTAPLCRELPRRNTTHTRADGKGAKGAASPSGSIIWNGYPNNKNSKEKAMKHCNKNGSRALTVIKAVILPSAARA